MSLGSDSNKREILAALKSKLKNNDFYATEECVNNISRNLLGDNAIEPFGDYEFMNWEQLKELKAAEIFELRRIGISNALRGKKLLRRTVNQSLRS